jgi:hypothetical protein
MEEDTAVNLAPYTKMLLDVMVPALVTILGTLVTVGVSRLNAILRSKVHNESFQCASNRLDKLVGDAVVEAERTLVREYAAASADGKLTKEEGLKVRDEVVEVVKRHLGERGRKELVGCLGHTDFSVVEGMIRTRIEAALAAMKGGSKPSPAPSVPPAANLARGSVPRSLSPDGPAKP